LWFFLYRLPWDYPLKIDKKLSALELNNLLAHINQMIYNNNIMVTK